MPFDDLWLHPSMPSIQTKLDEVRDGLAHPPRTSLPEETIGPHGTPNGCTLMPNTGWMELVDGMAVGTFNLDDPSTGTKSNFLAIEHTGLYPKTNAGAWIVSCTVQVTGSFRCSGTVYTAGVGAVPCLRNRSGSFAAPIMSGLTGTQAAPSPPAGDLYTITATMAVSVNVPAQSFSTSGMGFGIVAGLSVVADDPVTDEAVAVDGSLPGFAAMGAGLTVVYVPFV